MGYQKCKGKRKGNTSTLIYDSFVHRQVPTTILDIVKKLMEIDHELDKYSAHKHAPILMRRLMKDDLAHMLDGVGDKKKKYYFFGKRDLPKPVKLLGITKIEEAKELLEKTGCFSYYTEAKEEGLDEVQAVYLAFDYMMTALVDKHVKLEGGKVKILKPNSTFEEARELATQHNFSFMRQVEAEV